MTPPGDAVTGLREPIGTPDLRWVRFFNGRLLTGDDLGREQAANRAARRLVGQAAGSGVAWGLEVADEAGLGTAAAPVLSVQAGLAIAPSGEALELTTATMVALTADTGATSAGNGSGFVTCQPQVPGTYSVGTGVFVLTVGPASFSEGRAEVSGLPGSDPACDVDHTIDGVQFKLCRIALDRALDADQPRLRNRLAHLAFGTDDPGRLSATIDPFGHHDARYGLLDQLPAGCIGGDEVPLALVRWTAAGIDFVDRWAVRRRLVAPPAGTRYGAFAGDRRRAEAEAALLQFEDEIEELRTALAAPEQLRAVDRFAFLPPAGLLPAAVPGAVAGFRPATFFGAAGSSEVATIDAEGVGPLLRASFQHEAIVVGAERVQLYRIVENGQAVANRQAEQPAVLFAKHTLPYAGIARFGSATFGRSRFAPRIV